MTANYEINVKLNIVQNDVEIHELLDMWEIEQEIAETLADKLAFDKAVVTVELKEGKLDAK